MSNACCADHPVTSQDDETEARNSLRLQFALTGICLVTLLAAWLGPRLLPGFPPALGIALYAAAYLSGGFFPTRGVLEDLREFRFNVNFLMVFAAIGAACIGQAVEGAVLMFLFSLSGALENFASGRTRRAIRGLLKLSPSEATILRDGREERIAVAALKIGDVLVVRPGERFAGDGVITEGNTSVDESSLTGEAIPVDRGPGSRVMAGTINRFGAVKVGVDREVADTTLAKIFKIIGEAQQQKAPTQRLIEKWGGPYTALILISTALTLLGGLYWQHEAFAAALYRAMTLMVVASPCALVLSIPSAVLAAIAAGAWRGILFKGGLAVELLGQVRVVAFDKTGTLTMGKPRLAEARYGEGLVAKEILSQVAAVEQHSEHPLAKVLVDETRQQGIAFAEAMSCKAIPGMGMEGRVNASQIRIGSETFICLNGGMEPWAREVIVNFRARGLTCLIAATNRTLAVFGVSDTLRPGAPRAIAGLKELGVQSVMLTGDHAASAAQFAKQLGLDGVHASLLPHQKVEVLRDLSREHETVAMVGDGVNDAPALVSAQVGIAMGGSGSATAMENADVVLMSDAIERVPEILDLGRRTRAIIRQNLIFAIGVIVVLVLSTFFARLDLAAGVVGHEGSTVLVVFNSLRLLGRGGMRRESSVAKAVEDKR